MEIILQAVESGGAIILLAVVIVLAIVPAMRNIGKQSIVLQQLVDRIEEQRRDMKEQGEQYEQLFERIATLQERCFEHSKMTRIALRVAFAGRGNGHTWEEAKRHYEIASSLLADADADKVLAALEKERKKDGLEGRDNQRD